jgi:2-polyprenyl-3-methyl-5-hydroxy-6-metoxy-1,4-benzoquinol methylase
MKIEQEKPVDQARWNQHGIERIREIESNPGKYIVSNLPRSHREAHDELMQILSPIKGKRILELGCGRGDFSIWLAKQGARVTAVDIGPDLVAAAQVLAKVNQVDCEFRQANITELPFDPEAYDVVIGWAILHHLTEADVLKTIRECHRVSKTDGSVVFQEPVENSALFNFIQNLFPAGQKGSRYYRPSILRRKAWTGYLKALDDRTMTNQELLAAGAELFRNIKISPHGFLIRLIRLIGYKHRTTLLKLDRVLFKVFPPLKHYSQTVLVEYQK